MNRTEVLAYRVHAQQLDREPGERALTWTLRSSPHYYRRFELAEVATQLRGLLTAPMAKGEVSTTCGAR